VDQHDEQEFARYFAARRDAVRRSAYLLCGDWHRADDLAQTAFVALHRRWHKIRDRAALDAYVRRTVVRAVIDESRRPWRRERFTGEVPEVADTSAGTPEIGDRVATRTTLVAALRKVPPRQRAVLVLRDVLQWKAAEVGAAVGASTAAVNSLLQRAHAQLEAVGPKQDDAIAAPEDPETQDLLDRYIAAFEAYDIDQLVELFTAEAVWEMPPFDGWYVGPEAIGALSRDKCPAERAGDMRFLRTTANGQPAAAMYMRTPETGVHEAFQLHVLAISPGGVSHVVAFLDTTLFEKFGLPASL
jgi:RNA polymerase sigma-70 factor (ECF subfamily)